MSHGRGVIALVIALGAAACSAPLSSSQQADGAMPAASADCDAVPAGDASQGASPMPGDPASTDLLWSADYESGDLSQFRDSPWNNQPLAPEVSAGIARSGEHSGVYVVPPGGSRSESIPPRALDFQEGDERWFSFSTLLGPGIPEADDWQVVAQWKNDGDGSPPLALSIESGRFELGGGWGWPGTNDPQDPRQVTAAVGPALAGRWDDWMLRVTFSSDPEIGSVSLWRNGTNMICDWPLPGGTLYPGLTSYLKVGYYRSPSLRSEGTVHVDDVHIGRTRESVDPRSTPASAS